MSGLPEGWEKSLIGDLVNIIRGVTFPASSKVHEASDDVIACLRTSHIQEKLLWDNIYFIPRGYVRREEQLTRRNDVLISMANSSNLVGKVCINESNEPACFGAFLAALRCNEISYKYFYYFMRSSEAQSKLRSTASQTVNIANISVAELERLEMPLAPLAEQTRIAEKLDELLVQVDTLKARIDAILTLLKRFRQSVLAAAVSGRLTEDWRVKASAWNDTTIGQVCSVATGKTPKRDTTGYWEDGDIPWLTSALTGSEFCSKAEQFVTAFAVKNCALKVFQPGTLLMAMYGEGKTRGQVTELKIAATCNQACAALVVDESIARKAFVKIRLQENYEETRKQAVGGAQPNLNLNKVREIAIRLPSLPEQTEIVRRVEQLFAFADQLEAKVAAAKTRIDHLTQSILAKAFRGELVSRDSNDEPARVLLERIKAQRAAAPKAKRGRKKVEGV